MIQGGTMSATTTKLRAREYVYQEVRRRIIRYSLPPGIPVSENELAAEFGLSRTPVREALLLLAGEGFVRIEPKVGTFVTKLQRAAIREAQFLREAVETTSLASLGLPLDPQVLEELEENIRLQKAGTNDLLEFAQLDDDFHRGLMRLAGHGGSWRVVSEAKGHLDRARHITPTTRMEQGTLVAQHAAILNAVKAADIVAALSMLQKHLRIVLRDLEILEESQPEIFG